MVKRCLTVSALAAVICLLPSIGTADDVNRPRDPWVFRSVLDGRARMLTLAFHDKLYAAYDTQDCSLRRAWAGEVKFTGGVYDARHGPQPQSVGKPYFQINDDAGKSASGKSAGAWSLLQNGQRVDTRPHYLGYKIEQGGNAVAFEFEMAVPGGKVAVEEKPECRIEGDAVTLVRTFKVSGLPSGATLVLSLEGKPTDFPVDVAIDAVGPTSSATLTRQPTTAPTGEVQFNADGTMQVRMTWRTK